MAVEHCWFCGRDRQRLIDDMPPGFWDEQQGMFFDVEVIGSVCAIDKVRPGDPLHWRHFRRAGGPEDEVCSFDDRRFAVVARKRAVVKVCRVCRCVEAGLRAISEDGKTEVPHRSIYMPGTDEPMVAKMWEKVRKEERTLRDEYPDEAYRVLVAIKDLNRGGPISLWDLSQEMRVFNHRSLERPVSHILRQCPEIGQLDRKSLVLHIEDPLKASGLIDQLLLEYERSANTKPVSAPPQPADEVLFRIKKLNNQTDAVQISSKW